MKTFDLYGFSGIDIETARAAVERALNIRMAPHESLYVGDYYLFRSETGEKLQLQENFEPLDEEVLEEDFPDFGVLLYVSDSERPDEVASVLVASVPQLKFLRRETI